MRTAIQCQNVVRRPYRRSAAACGLVLLMPAVGLAQYAGHGDGRILDRNPSVQGGRFNSPRPVSPLMSGNLTATGNVRFGRSLRSFSPVFESGAFRAGLPSSFLSTFSRDSVGVSDLGLYQSSLRGGGFAATTPFYDPGRTAPTASYLLQQGTYQHRSNLSSFQSVPRGRSTPLPSAFGVVTPLDTRIDGRFDFGSRIHEDTSVSRELSSSIFGVPQTPLPTELMLDPQETSLIDPRFRETRDPSLAERGPSPWDPLDFRMPSSLAESATGPRLQAALSGDSNLLLIDAATPFHTDADTPETEPEPPSPTVHTPLRVDPSLLPGGSVFGDLRLALSLEEDPGAEWFKELQTALREDPAAAVDVQEAAQVQSDEFVQRMMTTPIRTFVGKAETPINDVLFRAETAMERGEYYQGARLYEQAATLDLTNPLPLIGQGHALLAAGEYRSAVAFLLRGLERFPQISRFGVDLERLLGGGEAIDIRRADLMRLIERNEDPRLRFLLGYLEVHSGNRAFGLENLDRAAQDAEIGSFIRRYPELLRAADGGRAAPAPTESK